jgi:hypothetical protein
MRSIAKGSRQGSILLLTIFFMYLIFMVAMAYAFLVPQDLRATMRQEMSLQGSYVADIGLQETLHALRANLPTNPTFTPAAAPSGRVGDWDWRSSVVAGQVPTDRLQRYFVKSIASQGGRDYVMQQVVLREVALTQYQHFNGDTNDFFSNGQDKFNNDATGIAHGLYWPAQTVQGRVHYNSVVRQQLLSTAQGPAPVPIFQAQVSQSAPRKPPRNASLLDGAFYVWEDPSLGTGVPTEVVEPGFPPPTAAPYSLTSDPTLPYKANGDPRYARASQIYAAGVDGLETGVAPIEMPNLGYLSGLATTHLNGDVLHLVLDANSFTYTMVSGATQTLPYAANCVIYVDGNIWDIHSINAINHDCTIATNVANANECMVIPDSIRASNTASVGLVSQNIWLPPWAGSQNGSLPPPTSFQIDACIYAGLHAGGSWLGQFGIRNGAPAGYPASVIPAGLQWSSFADYPVQGTVTINGSMAVALGDETAMVMAAWVGWTPAFVYNTQSAKFPPPGFPVSGRFVIDYFLETPLR